MLYEIVQNMSKETRRLLCDIFVMLVEKCKTQPEAVKGFFRKALVKSDYYDDDDFESFWNDFVDLSEELNANISV